MSCSGTSTARATWTSSLCRRLSLVAVLVSAATLLTPGTARASCPGPGPAPSLETAISSSQVIVSGTFLGTTGHRGNLSAQFLVQHVIKGDVGTGRITIDLSHGGFGQEGQGEVALLAWHGGRLVPATLRKFCGGFAFLPAESAGFSPATPANAEVVRELGNVVLDSAAPLGWRRQNLALICTVSSAAPIVRAAGDSANLVVRFGALACQISRGDSAALVRFAGRYSSAAPPPEAAELAPAIQAVRKPQFIPALAATAQVRMEVLRLAAIRALGFTLSCAAIAPLRSVLLHGTEQDRAAAANALTYIVPGPPRPITLADFESHQASITAALLKAAARPDLGCRR